MSFYNLSEFNTESDDRCGLDTSKDNIPVFRVVFDQHDPNQGVKSIQLTDKPIYPFKIMETKQSGYQKLKAEVESLRKDVFKMIAGTDEEKREVIAKHTVPAPPTSEALEEPTWQ